MDWLRKFPRAIWHQILATKPSFLSKTPYFNYISAHYTYILGLLTLSSILIFATRTATYVPFVDAIFMAASGLTQAGLNTIDVNKLSLFAQIVIYFCMLLSNPMVTNTAVVFLRLYWFQRQFQRVVYDAKRNRVSLSMARTLTLRRDDPDVLERGATVGNPTTNPVAHSNGGSDGGSGGATGNSVLPNNVSHEAVRLDQTLVAKPLENQDAELLPMHQPAITFADNVKRNSNVPDQLPVRREPFDHIAILQRQRNTDGVEPLRIPNPRDVERGVKPEVVAHGANDPDEDEARMSFAIEQPAVDPAQSNNPPRYRSEKLNEPRQRPKSKWHIRATMIANTLLAPMRLRNPKRKVEKPANSAPMADGYVVTRRNTLRSLREAISSGRDDAQNAPYLSWTPTIGRNSQFVGLDEEQREELGGIEYRALKTLATMLLVYFWGIVLIGAIGFVGYIETRQYYGRQVDAFAVNRVWWAFFTSLSSIVNCGLTPMPNSMVSFYDSNFVLLWSSFLTVGGYTGYPVLLRFMIWVTSRMVPRGSALWEELRFLLDHPRRCYTLLFPSKVTWVLFLVLVVFNGVDLFLFMILNLPGSGTGVSKLPVTLRFLNGWFMATATRTVGYASFALSSVHPAVIVSYLIMMYISVFPISISIRRSNVYEERSLGLYPDHSEGDEENSYAYVAAHIRRQLSFDIWFVGAALFLLACSEGAKLLTADVDFSLFAFIFEIVSAYGTVGLSLGYKDDSTSLSGRFTTVGKLIMVAVMVRGRHRGLPYGLDRAILLPSQRLNDIMESSSGRAPPTGYADDHDGGVLGPVASHATHASGFLSMSASGARGRRGSRSMERPTRSLLSRAMQPGPALPHSVQLAAMSGSRSRSNSRASRNSMQLGGTAVSGLRLRSAVTEPPRDQPLLSLHHHHHHHHQQQQQQQQQQQYGKYQPPQKHELGPEKHDHDLESNVGGHSTIPTGATATHTVAGAEQPFHVKQQ